MERAIILDRIEQLYLAVLRVVLLIAATLMIIGVLWLLAVSITAEFKSTDGIVAASPSVSADEIVAEGSKTTGENSGPRVDPSHRAYYENFLTQYYALYASKFEKFRKAEDQAVNKGDFESLLVDIEGRLALDATGDLDFSQDKRRLEQLLAVMSQVAAKPPVIAKLKQYQSASKQNVCQNETRYRDVRVKVWDSNSRSCDAWYEAPIGCSAWSTVRRPYQARECSLQYPAGLKKPIEIFEDYQVRFSAAYDSDQKTKDEIAQAERERILDEKVAGKESLTRSWQVLVAFLILMFFFLLVAIERHQRRMTAILKGSSTASLQ